MNNSLIVIFLIGLASVIGENEFGDLETRETTFEIHETTAVSPATNGTKKMSWGVIYPGTKWCGQGNKAKDDNDFGKFKTTDRCCRDHDRCPDKIRRGEANHGIHNNGTITLLSCHCDDNFFDCLKGTRTRTSKIVGTLYFDIVRNKCFMPSEENSQKFVLTKSRRFSSNRFLKWAGRMLG